MLFAALYFSEGAPIGYIWWALPTRLSEAGMPVQEVTAITSLLVLPWALKFLWAPLVDGLQARYWPLRNWILLAQGLMAIPLFALMGVEASAETAGLLKLLLLSHAVFAATQDVAIDALAVRATPRAELGSLNAWMQGGMLAGRGLFGGASLWAEQYIGADAVIALLIGAIWCSAILVLVLRPEAARDDAPGRLRRIGAAFIAVARARNTWLGLLFALVAATAFETVGAMAGPMLLERGYERGTVGLLYAAPIIIATVAGGFLGGRLSDWFGRVRAAGWSLLGTAMAVVGLAAIIQWTAPALAPPHEMLGVLVVYVAVGALTTTQYALLMSLTDRRIAGTQFSAFMGATNLCESWSGRLGGRMAGAYGFAPAWALAAAISLAALPILGLIRRAGGPRDMEDAGGAGDGRAPAP